MFTLLDFGSFLEVLRIVGKWLPHTVEVFCMLPNPPKCNIIRKSKFNKKMKKSSWEPPATFRNSIVARWLRDRSQILKYQYTKPVPDSCRLGTTFPTKAMRPPLGRVLGGGAPQESGPESHGSKYAHLGGALAGKIYLFHCLAPNPNIWKKCSRFPILVGFWKFSEL